MRQHRSSLVLGGAILLGVFTGSTLSASGGNDVITENTPTSYVTVSESQGWTTYEYQDDIPNAEQREYQGQRRGDGCTFSGSRTISGDSDTVSVEREVAFHASDCVMITEVGDVSRAQLHSKEPPTGIEATEVALPTGEGDDG